MNTESRQYSAFKLGRLQIFIEQMAKAAFLRSQIVNVVFARLGYQRYLLDDRYAVDLKAIDLLGIVGQYAYISQSEIAAYLSANSVVSLVGTETQLRGWRQRCRGLAPEVCKRGVCLTSRCRDLPAVDKLERPDRFSLSFS